MVMLSVVEMSSFSCGSCLSLRWMAISSNISPYEPPSTHDLIKRVVNRNKSDRFFVLIFLQIETIVEVGSCM